jgi:hypothetical protein
VRGLFGEALLHREELSSTGAVNIETSIQKDEMGSR